MRPASQIGHGATGLRSNLRSFNELAEQSYCQRVAFADLGLGKQLQGAWSGDASVAWSQSVTETFDGVAMEMVSLSTALGDTLTRVERQADVIATSNSYTYDVESGVVYVKLTGDVDPNTTVLEAVFLKRFGSCGSVEPVFGPSKAANFNFADWNSGTTPTGWLNSNVGVNGVATLQSLDVPDGSTSTFSLQVSPGSGGMTAGTSGGMLRPNQLYVLGGHYFLSFAYKTDPNMPDTLFPSLRLVVDTSTFIASDGRDTVAAANDINLQHTGGEWRRVLFVFRAPATFTTGNVHLRLHNTSGSSETRGWVRWTDGDLARAYSYQYVEPRLPAGGIPATEVANQGTYMGEESVGVSQVRLLNSDDQYFENLLTSYDVIGRIMQSRRGGGFGDLELTFDDAWPDFPGVIRGLSVDDLGASFALQDLRSLMDTTLPLRTAETSTFPNMATKDVGKYRGILFGSVDGIAPIRTSYDGTSFLPAYEVVDGTDAPGTVMTTRNVYVYMDEDAAAVKDTSRRLTLPGTHYSTSGGTVSITGNPGPFLITGGDASLEVMGSTKFNDVMDLEADGNVYVIALTPGLYTAEQLATHIQTLLNALGAPGTFTFTYSNTTHKFNITWDKTSLQLFVAGANASRSVLGTVGFTSEADYASALSYTSDIALYDVSKVDAFVVRVDADGMLDDGSGTYTGSAAGAIIKAMDVWMLVLRKMLKRPASEADSPSFVAARSTVPYVQAIYLGGAGSSPIVLTAQELLDYLTTGTHSDAQMDGLGKWYWRPRPVSSAGVAAAGASAPILVDRDFLEFRSGKASEDVFASVRVTFGQDPGTGQVKSRTADPGKVLVKHGRAETRTFPTFLASAEDAQAQAWNLMLLAVLPRRRLEFTVKGRLLKKLPGDMVRVQRSRMLGAEVSGMLNEDVFRIQSIRVDPQTHTCEVLAYTADLPRNFDGPTPAALMLGSEARNKWKPFLWFGPSMKPVISPHRPGLISR